MSVQVFIPPVAVSETLKWCHYRSNFLCYWVDFFPKCCVLWCFYESDVLGCWLFPFTDGGNIYSNWELATYTNLWIPGKSNSSKTHIKSSFKKKGVVWDQRKFVSDFYYSGKHDKTNLLFQFSFFFARVWVISPPPSIGSSHRPPFISRTIHRHYLQYCVPLRAEKISLFFVLRKIAGKCQRLRLFETSWDTAASNHSYLTGKLKTFAKYSLSW